MRRGTLILVTLVLTLGALPAAEGSAAVRKRCQQATGSDLAKNPVVKVFRVRLGRTARYAYFGCARPRGPVVQLTHPFKGTDVKLLSVAGAYVATLHGGNEVLRTYVSDARTGKEIYRTNTPFSMDDDVAADPRPGAPSGDKVARAVVDTAGNLVVAYANRLEGSDPTRWVHLVGFTRRTAEGETDYFGEVFDLAPLAGFDLRSVRLVAGRVSWTRNGRTRTVPLADIGLRLAATGVGTVAIPGLSCRGTAPGTSYDRCATSLPEGSVVTVTASAAPGTPVQVYGCDDPPAPSEPSSLSGTRPSPHHEGLGTVTCTTTITAHSQYSGGPAVHAVFGAATTSA